MATGDLFMIWKEPKETAWHIDTGTEFGDKSEAIKYRNECRSDYPSANFEIVEVIDD